MEFLEKYKTLDTNRERILKHNCEYILKIK